MRIPEIADPDRFTFLFVFDQFSVMERKNPSGLIEAFKKAFPEPGEAQLVIKSINGDKRIEAAGAAALRRRTTGPTSSSSSATSAARSSTA